MLKVVVVSAILLLAVVLIVRTVNLSREPAQKSQCRQTDSDFIPLNEERLQRFQIALGFESVSRDSGDSNTDEIFKMGEFIIASFPHIHRHSPLVTWERVNNLSLLYHIQGSDPSLKPYLLMAHIDVVPVTNLDQWDAPPFSGEVKDGFIYGRGTIDDKNNVMTNKCEGAASVANRLREKGVDQFHFIVDEGVPVFDGIFESVDGPIASVGVTEKGYVELNLSVELPPGHSSMPPRETAIGILARAVQRLEENPHPSMLGSGIETDMLESLVPKMSYLQRVVISNIWLFRYPVSWVLSKMPMTNALIRTVTAVTIFNSGIKFNIVPPLAEAIVNHRVHPSQTVKEVVDYDRAVINDPRVKIEVLYSMEPHPVAGHGESDFGYQVLRTSIKQLWPHATVSPAILVGNTDTIHFLNLSTNVYRFSPTHMFPGDPERFHGINERMSVKNYEQVINFFYHLIRNADQAGLSPVHSAHPDL